ncbi:uncharacterized protein LOC123425341 [Hordeum vulgare subsp. vulgare]|uniref:uncharacterized protein LOC123425341 n=1 Tax=Hordeum vulgare subsp. vulgare TaxID=112509 RepID=UPI001D1A4919|nr:uncharacterized protein LOC123425341 [Hordeum vulgare subsp. vulgare]
MKQHVAVDDGTSSTLASSFSLEWGSSALSIDLNKGSLASDGIVLALVVDDEGVTVDDLPRENEDLDFFGVDYSCTHKCHHKMQPARKVAFVYAATGRRYLGCPLKGAERCRWVKWIDELWGPCSHDQLCECGTNRTIGQHF